MRSTRATFVPDTPNRASSRQRASLSFSCRGNLDTIASAYHSRIFHLIAGTWDVPQYSIPSPPPIPDNHTPDARRPTLQTSNPQMVNNELGLLMDRLDPVRGKIFWRSFGLTVASSTPSMVWLNPSHVDCEGDRVLCYFSTWIVHLKVRSVSCTLQNLRYNGDFWARPFPPKPCGGGRHFYIFLLFLFLFLRFFILLSFSFPCFSCLSLFCYYVLPFPFLLFFFSGYFSFISVSCTSIMRIMTTTGS